MAQCPSHCPCVRTLSPSTLHGASKTVSRPPANYPPPAQILASLRFTRIHHSFVSRGVHDSRSQESCATHGWHQHQGDVSFLRCHSESTQTGGLTTADIYSPTGLGAGSPTSRCQQGHSPSEVPREGPSCSSQLLAAPGAPGRVAAPLPSLAPPPYGLRPVCLCVSFSVSSKDTGHWA